MATTYSKTKTLEQKAFIHASGIVLTEKLPRGYVMWSDEKIYDFVEDKVRDLYLEWDTSEVLDEISNLSKELVLFLNNNNL